MIMYAPHNHSAGGKLQKKYSVGIHNKLMAAKAGSVPVASSLSSPGAQALSPTPKGSELTALDQEQVGELKQFVKAFQADSTEKSWKVSAKTVHRHHDIYMFASKAALDPESHIFKNNGASIGSMDSHMLKAPCGAEALLELKNAGLIGSKNLIFGRMMAWAGSSTVPKSAKGPRALLMPMMKAKVLNHPSYETLSNLSKDERYSAEYIAFAPVF
mmetsp:Transcript_34979/g.85717  ORF Transcript_34979/g.85717 Transcript_34979/m.85717 type:complete len:215 (+) Transcript_34979:316-960(+)